MTLASGFRAQTDASGGRKLGNEVAERLQIRPAGPVPWDSEVLWVWWETWYLPVSSREEAVVSWTGIVTWAGAAPEFSHPYIHIFAFLFKVAHKLLEHGKKVILLFSPGSGLGLVIWFDLFTLTCVVDGNPDQSSAPSSDISTAVCGVKSQRAVSGIILLPGRS